jgi:hypothetical protein
LYTKLFIIGLFQRKHNLVTVGNSAECREIVVALYNVNIGASRMCKPDVPNLYDFSTR